MAHGNPRATPPPAPPSAPKLELSIYDASTKQRLVTLESHQSDRLTGDASVVFSPDGRYVAARRVFAAVGPEQVTRQTLLGPRTKTLDPPEPLRIWDAQTGRALPSLDGDNGSTTVLTFSPDSRLLATVSSASPAGTAQAQQADEVTVWTVGTSRPALRLKGNSVTVDSLAFSADSNVLAVAGHDGVTRFWSMQTGLLTGSVASLKGGEWLAMSPSGLFDGSPGAWPRLAWRTGQDLGDVGPVELYFSEFFRPGLLSEIATGRRLESPRAVSEIDRRQPAVRLVVLPASESRQVRARIEVNDTGSGVRDVRLFRNGTLVHVWRGELQPDAAGMVRLETDITVVAGDNQLVAYCFNRHNVKSNDALGVARGAESLRRRGTAWIVAIGLNRYVNPEFNLKFAAADAQVFASQLGLEQSRLDVFEKVEIVELLDGQATRSNILLALDVLAGHTPAQTLPAALKSLRSAQPEDTVFLYFAGHGFARGDRFYLVPHDLGYMGTRGTLASEAMDAISAKAISDLDLERSLGPVDAGHILLVIDACQSGQALESEERRRGPMNSKGLAQLAYEKGMYILTASQSYQAAMETSRLGHGFLTYALVEDGLKSSMADILPRDGRILAKEWLEYAIARVPQLQLDAMRESERTGRVLVFEAAPGSQGSPRLQTPRFFSRIDTPSEELLIAKRP
jgi:hypothetical protein